MTINVRSLVLVLGYYGAVLVGTWCYWVRMGRYWLVLGVTGSGWGGTGWYLVLLGQYGAVLVGSWWNWVIMGGTGWYSVVLCQYGAVVVGICWYWVSIGRHWLVFGGTGSE